MINNNNVLRELIDNDQPTIGTHMYSPWPGMAEVIGHAGTIDYIEFSGTYAPYDLFSLESFARATDLFKHMTGMVKLDQEPRTYLAERAVGAGIPNLLFADLRTVEDAQEAADAMQPESPITKKGSGIAGANARRDTGYGSAYYHGKASSLQEYMDTLEQGVLAVMIEKKEAVDDLENILSVKRIDMVQFGPSDYSMSIGVPDQYDHPDVKKADKFIIKLALEHGIRPRIEIDDWEDAKPYIDMGVKDFCISADIAVVQKFCKDNGESLLKLLGR